MKHIEIAKVLTLAKENKYEMACATFDVVDHIFKVDVPRSLRGRKMSIQAMSLLADGVVQFGYEKDHSASAREDASSTSEEE